MTNEIKTLKGIEKERKDSIFILGFTFLGGGIAGLLGYYEVSIILLAISVMAYVDMRYWDSRYIAEKYYK